jgi:hypothetical protein
MSVMIFVVGALLGLLFGASVCIKYVRQEMTASVAPRLNRIQVHLESLEAEVNLALATRRSEFGHRYMIDQPPDL